MRYNILSKFVLMLFLLVLTTSVFAINPADENKFLDAREKLTELNKGINEVRNEGFGVVRLLDEYAILVELYNNAKVIADSNKPVDLALFFERESELEKLLDSAKQTRDELLALRTAIDSIKGSIDTNEVEAIYTQAEQEFSDQRYELSIKKIDEAYEKIVELQGIEAKASAAYEAAQKNVLGFIEKYWQILAAIILIPIVIYAIFRRRIELYIVTNKINAIEFEVNVLKDEIRKAQRSYFVDGALAEEEYTIKAKMYSEKIRDLHGTLALFVEKQQALLPRNKKLDQITPKEKSLNRKKR